MASYLIHSIDVHVPVSSESERIFIEVVLRAFFNHVMHPEMTKTLTLRMKNKVFKLISQSFLGNRLGVTKVYFSSLLLAVTIRYLITIER